MGIYLLYIIPVVLIHYVHGEGVLFNIDKNSISKTVGKSVSVVCMVEKDTENFEKAKIQWFDNNNVAVTSTYSIHFPYVIENFPTSLGDTGLLMTIFEVGKDSAGSYKCVATINDGVNDRVYEKTLQIVITDNLTFTKCDSEQFGILLETSVIHCTATSGSDRVDTHWGPNLNIGNNDNLLATSTSLTILKTTLADAGEYVYNAFTIRDSSFRTITFDVYTYPTMKTPLLQSTAVVGKEVTLYCTATGRPDPIIEWTSAKTTNKLETTDRLVVTQTKQGDDVQGSLKIKSVIKEDETKYTCTAKNLATKKNMVNPPESTMELIVQIPPKIEHMDDRKGTEGGPTNLECIARGNPIPNIIWEKVDTGERYSSGSNDPRISVNSAGLNDPDNPGSKLTLSFTKLAHSDAGEYRCEAKNSADTAKAIVNLEVLYRPNFENQGKTTFYTWEGRTDSFIQCVSNANTAPAFKWYRDSRELTAGDSYRIGTTVITPDNDQQATSKLFVTFNGNNDDEVFGNFMCKAFNPTGENNITLSMVKAEYPADPVVTVQEEGARFIKFWLYKPQMIGPDATHFKVVYKVPGSDKKAKTQLVRINDRDIADIARTYTVLDVVDLQHNTDYIFTFYTINPVGQSSGNVISRTTQQRSVPKDPVVLSQINSVYSDRIMVNWKVPSDGGAIILEYKLTYQLINVKSNSSSDVSIGYEMLSPISPEVVINGIKDSSYAIDKLVPGKYYQVKVYAHNSVGYSVPGERIFKTKEATNVPGASSGPLPRPNTSGAPKMVAVSVSVTVFGCLAALSACMKRFV